LFVNTCQPVRSSDCNLLAARLLAIVTLRTRAVPKVHTPLTPICRQFVVGPVMQLAVRFIICCATFRRFVAQLSRSKWISSFRASFWRNRKPAQSEGSSTHAIGRFASHIARQSCAWLRRKKNGSLRESVVNRANTDVNCTYFACQCQTYNAKKQINFRKKGNVNSATK